MLDRDKKHGKGIIKKLTHKLTKSSSVDDPNATDYSLQARRNLQIPNNSFCSPKTLFIKLIEYSTDIWFWNEHQRKQQDGKEEFKEEINSHVQERFKKHQVSYHQRQSYNCNYKFIISNIKKLTFFCRYARFSVDKKTRSGSSSRPASRNSMTSD